MENYFGEDNNIEEIKDLIEKYFRLQEQIDNPSRAGMIKALSAAHSIAQNEIAEIEKSQGDNSQTSWSDMQDHDLYSKLPQYKQGLYNYAVNKVGEETFKYMLDECI